MMSSQCTCALDMENQRDERVGAQGDVGGSGQHDAEDQGLEDRALKRHKGFQCPGFHADVLDGEVCQNWKRAASGLAGGWDLATIVGRGRRV